MIEALLTVDTMVTIAPSGGVYNPYGRFTFFHP